MIQITNIAKSFGGQSLFNNVSVNIPSKARVGLVGRNGSGKSTLFKIILGEELPDSGKVSIPKNYHLGSLKQHIEFTKATVLEECVQELREDQKFETYRAEKILSGLGFSEEDFHKDPHSFSGGFQIRINLAKLLVTEPNLLMLDEPTNYLDIVSLRWLQNFLRNFDGEVLIITHDQEFMDTVTTHTMGLHRKELKFIQGDTAKFYTQLIQEEELYEKTRLNTEKKRKEMERFIERFKAKASKATQAQSKLKQLQKMESLDELEAETDLNFNFNYSELAAKQLMEVNNLSFGYQADQKLFNDISFFINQKECIGIIGKNGKGKSTLLNCLSGDLDPEGEVKFHSKTQLAHFGQTNIARLSENLSIVEEVRSKATDSPDTKIRQICGTMMFPGELADKKIKVLSGGEKSRVMLGKIIASPSNLLLLDEPTNHLDMQSIESLCEAVEDFPGGVIIVTHSEMLLRRLATKLIIFRKNQAEYFHGTYEDFLNKIGWEEEEHNKPKVVAKLSKKEIQKQRALIIKERSKILSPLKKKVEEAEKTITESEEILEAKNAELIKASEESNGELITTLSQEVSQLEATIEEAFIELELAQADLDQQNSTFEKRLNEVK